MTKHLHIVILGGGPAGTQAALAAAGPNRHITLVSDGPPGGRAVWQTLLPSKLWLHAGETPSTAFEDGNPQPLDLSALHTQYEQVAGAWQRQILEELERAGVELRLGFGSFLSPREIQIRTPEGGYPDQISADVVIIASGSVPFVPPGLKPDGERIFSPNLVWKIPSVPRDLVVIGSGGPATEYVDAFSRLGVKIKWITGPVGVLSAYPPDAGRFIAEVMTRRGVEIITGKLARQIDQTEEGVAVVTADGGRHKAEMAFVAIGLRPDLERLNLPAAGLKPGSSGGLGIDTYGRTAVPHIYLVGDAASPLSANVSIAQGRMAGWHAAGVPVEPLRLEHAVMAIYTNPQVAMVGRMSDRSEQLHRVRVPFSACLRAHLPNNHAILEDAGFLEITYDPTRRVIGALAVCPEAAEILTPLAVAIRAEMTIDELASVYPAHPTFSELGILAARIAK
jgi:pyruvate/2-oxoglutarate dehydrogenase complex dihydrolipoamide dehydrogenase (E3) component